MRMACLVFAALFAGSASAQSAPPSGAAACSGCHATSAATEIPSLQGLGSDAIAAALRGFRTGERPATVMDRIAKGFTEEESRAIAEWLAARR